MSSLLATPPPPGKRIKRTASPAKRIQRTDPAVGPVPANDDDNDRTYSPRMAFVHRQSCEGVKSELDLFAVPPTQISFEEGGWIEHQPLTSLDSGGPIELILPRTGDAYLDLANTYLLVRAKIVNRNGTDIVADTPVAPVNKWLHSSSVTWTYT